MPRYLIHVRPKLPAYDDPGLTFEIEAPNQKRAVSLARREVASLLVYSAIERPLCYSASRIDPPGFLFDKTCVRACDDVLAHKADPLASLPALLPRHIGMLCRAGVPVFYTFPPGGSYRESPDWTTLVTA